MDIFEIYFSEYGYPNLQKQVNNNGFFSVGAIIAYITYVFDELMGSACAKYVSVIVVNLFIQSLAA